MTKISWEWECYIRVRKSDGHEDIFVTTTTLTESTEIIKSVRDDLDRAFGENYRIMRCGTKQDMCNQWGRRHKKEVRSIPVPEYSVVYDGRNRPYKQRRAIRAMSAER